MPSSARLIRAFEISHEGDVCRNTRTQRCWDDHELIFTPLRGRQIELLQLAEVVHHPPTIPDARQAIRR